MNKTKLIEFLKYEIEKTEDAHTGDFDSGINYVCTKLLEDIENGIYDNA